MTLSRFWLWRAPAVVAGLAAALFVAGFVLALRGTMGEPVGGPPPPLASAGTVKTAGRRFLLVLGDSLARGTGDETGKGFASDVFETLKKGRPADMANLAVNGAESSDVLKVLDSENVRRLAASADWILLSVGGNDLSHSVPGRGAMTASPMEELGASRGRYAANLRQILSRLRDANPQAPIALLALYDPFGNEGPQARVGASIILSWNTLIEETALSFSNVSVVPTFDIFYGRSDRLAVDRFHPNGKGHQAIADRILQILPST